MKVNEISGNLKPLLFSPHLLGHKWQAIRHSGIWSILELEKVQAHILVINLIGLVCKAIYLIHHIFWTYRLWSMVEIFSWINIHQTCDQNYNFRLIKIAEKFDLLSLLEGVWNSFLLKKFFAISHYFGKRSKSSLNISEKVNSVGYSPKEWACWYFLLMSLVPKNKIIFKFFEVIAHYKVPQKLIEAFLKLLLYD